MKALVFALMLALFGLLFGQPLHAQDAPTQTCNPDEATATTGLWIVPTLDDIMAIDAWLRFGANPPPSGQFSCVQLISISPSQSYPGRWLGEWLIIQSAS